MRQLSRFTETYFQKFGTEPVAIKPFDSLAKEIAGTYIAQLKHLFIEAQFPEFNLVHRGSTAFGIAGKGDIEIGVYLPNDYWFKTIVFLANHFKGIGNLDLEYARFNDVYKDYEIEIILMSGYLAELDVKLNNFLMARPDLLSEYIELKQRYCYSKREYQIQKNDFFQKIIASIPETSD